MEFFRQEHWSGLPFPSPGDLSNPGIKPRSPTLWADALLSEPPGSLAIVKEPMNKTHFLKLELFSFNITGESTTMFPPHLPNYYFYKLWNRTLGPMEIM